MKAFLLKKKKLILTALGCIVLVSTIIISVYLMHGEIFTCPSDVVNVLFGCSYDEFFTTDLELYKEIGDLRKGAYTIYDDYLTLYLSPKKIKTLKQSEWLTSFDYLDDVPYIEVSEDFSEVTLYYTFELRQLDKEKSDEFTCILRSVFAKIDLINCLDGYKNPKTTFKVVHDWGFPVEDFEMPERGLPNYDFLKGIEAEDMDFINKAISTHYPNGTLIKYFDMKIENTEDCKIFFLLDTDGGIDFVNVELTKGGSHYIARTIAENISVESSFSTGSEYTIYFELSTTEISDDAYPCVVEFEHNGQKYWFAIHDFVINSPSDSFL